MSGRLLNMNLGLGGTVPFFPISALCIHPSSPNTITIVTTVPIPAKLSPLNPTTCPTVGLSTKHITIGQGDLSSPGCPQGGCRFVLLGCCPLARVLLAPWGTPALPVVLWDKSSLVWSYGVHSSILGQPCPGAACLPLLFLQLGHVRLNCPSAEPQSSPIFSISSLFLSHLPSIYLLFPPFLLSIPSQPPPSV